MSANDARPVPFFIVGCGRSGTTLLQALIDSHPNVAIPPESYIYVRFGPIFRSYGDLEVRRNRYKLIGALLRDASIRLWRMDTTTADVAQRVTRNSFAGIIEALFSCYAEMNGAMRWGDKTPAHIRHLHEIRRDFPRAKLIHLLRDGRDVAEAMRRMIFYPVSPVGLARTWRDDVMHWHSFCATAGNVDTMVVRYEDLVNSPEDMVGSVFQFLNETYMDTISSYANSALSQKLYAEGPWHSSLRQGIDLSKIGVYRREFEAREIEIIESIEGDALRIYGYRPDNEAPRAPTIRDRTIGFVADRVVRWYRKLFYPREYWEVLQTRLRFAYRSLLGGFRKRTNEA